MKSAQRHLPAYALLALALASCAPDPSKAPVIPTPSGARVDLSRVSLQVSDAALTKGGENEYTLGFNYTLENRAGGNIVFPCLYNEIDELIQVNLSDQGGNPLILGKRPLEGLTLTEPRPLHIPPGKTSRSYQVPVTPAHVEPGELIHVRVRLHAPSRYDELRSSIEAPRMEVPWP